MLSCVCAVSCRARACAVHALRALCVRCVACVCVCVRDFSAAAVNNTVQSSTGCLLWGISLPFLGLFTVLSLAFSLPFLDLFTACLCPIHCLFLDLFTTLSLPGPDLSTSLSLHFPNLITAFH